MTSSRKTLCGTFVVACALVVVAAAQAGVEILKLDDALSLPDGIERLPVLEKQIGERLETLEAMPYSRVSMLELAYLFHANGYGDRAKALYDWALEECEGAKERSRLNYLAANAVKEKGDSATATAYLEASTRDYGEYPLAFARLGEAKLKSGDIEGAEAQFLVALSVDEELSLARLGLARIYEGRGELELGIRMLEKLLAYDPDNYNAQALLVRMLARFRDDKNAFALAQSFSISSSVPIDDPWLELVREYIFDPQRLDFLFLDYFRLGKYEKALVYLDKLERIDPGTARYCRYRGTLMMKQERYHEATECFRRDLALGGDDGATYPQLVQSLKQEGLVAEAESEARKGLLASDPDVELYLELARLLLDREAWNEAFSVLGDALEVDPYKLEVHLLRARLGFRLGSIEESKESLDMVQQLAPSDPEKLVRGGLICMEAGDFAAALPFLERARSVNPGYDEALELLADAHVQLAKASHIGGDDLQALQHLDQSLEVLPNAVEVLTAKTQILIGLNRFEEAEASMRVLVDSGVENPTILMIYGDLLYRNGRVSEARSVWQRALGKLDSGEAQKRIRQNLERRLGG